MVPVGLALGGTAGGDLHNWPLGPAFPTQPGCKDLSCVRGSFPHPKHTRQRGGEQLLVLLLFLKWCLYLQPPGGLPWPHFSALSRYCHPSTLLHVTHKCPL
ncbi:hypothetical protein H1C71_034524, partial [Ictidomys tridecemlineatus]